MDLVLEVVLLQQHTVTPHIRDMCAALKLHRKALKYSEMNGLHYRPLPFPLRILSISDASFATKSTS